MIVSAPQFAPQLEALDPVPNCTPQGIQYYFNPKAKHASHVKGCLRISHEKDWHLALANVNFRIAKYLFRNQNSAIDAITTIFNQILAAQNLCVKSIEHKGFQYHISTSGVLRIAPNSGTYMYIHVKPKEIAADLYNFCNDVRNKKKVLVGAQQKITFRTEQQFVKAIQEDIDKTKSGFEIVTAMFGGVGISIRWSSNTDKGISKVAVQASEESGKFSLESSEGITFSYTEKTSAVDKKSKSWELQIDGVLDDDEVSISTTPGDDWDFLDDEEDDAVACSEENGEAARSSNDKCDDSPATAKSSQS